MFTQWWWCGLAGRHQRSEERTCHMASQQCRTTPLLCVDRPHHTGKPSRKYGKRSRKPEPEDKRFALSANVYWAHSCHNTLRPCTEFGTPRSSQANRHTPHKGTSVEKHGRWLASLVFWYSTLVQTNCILSRRDQTARFVYATSLRIQEKQTHTLSKLTPLPKAATYIAVQLRNYVCSLDSTYILMCCPSEPLTHTSNRRGAYGLVPATVDIATGTPIFPRLYTWVSTQHCTQRGPIVNKGPLNPLAATQIATHWFSI